MKPFLLSILLLFQIGCTKSQNTEASPDPSVPDQRPNIIVIVAESHRAEALGVAGNPFVKTPNLDELARAGIMFDHAYVTTAICSVSRASLLTGQHRARHGINDFKTSLTHQAMLETFPVVLKNNGYTTALIGAYGVGKTPPSGYFDYWAGGIPWMAEGVHNTDNIVGKAEAWLEKQSEDQPFHLYLGFSAAHEIDPTAGTPAHYLVQKRHKMLYGDVTIPRPKTAGEQYWNAFPDFFRTDENIARKRWHGFFSTDELFQQNARDYYRLITGLDEAVGRLREKLVSLGLADNTIIVYTTDHGVSLGEHGMMGKWYGFDVGIHVPLIIYDPRHRELSDIRNSSIALNIDVAPTILTMAGVKVPSRMQGINLIDLVKGKAEERDAFFYEHTVFSTPALPKVEGVVTKTMRYMKYIEHDYEALYDFAKDPDESVNLAEDPAYAAKLDEMRLLFTEQRASAR